MKTETELEATNSQFVALKPNPVQHEEPLRGEADIAQHRRLYCGHYSRCLDVSVREGWSGFTSERSTRAWAALGLSLLMIAASFAHVMTHVMLPLLFANAVLSFAAGWLVLQHAPSSSR